jgi:hypothetical protein
VWLQLGPSATPAEPADADRHGGPEGQRTGERAGERPERDTAGPDGLQRAVDTGTYPWGECRVRLDVEWRCGARHGLHAPVRFAEGQRGEVPARSSRVPTGIFTSVSVPA